MFCICNAIDRCSDKQLQYFWEVELLQTLNYYINCIDIIGNEATYEVLT